MAFPSFWAMPLQWADWPAPALLRRERVLKARVAITSARWRLWNTATWYPVPHFFFGKDNADDHDKLGSEQSFAKTTAPLMRGCQRCFRRLDFCRPRHTCRGAGCPGGRGGLGMAGPGGYLAFFRVRQLVLCGGHDA